MINKKNSLHVRLIELDFNVIEYSSYFIRYKHKKIKHNFNLILRIYGNLSLEYKNGTELNQLSLHSFLKKYPIFLRYEKLIKIKKITNDK